MIEINRRACYKTNNDGVLLPLVVYYFIVICDNGYRKETPLNDTYHFHLFVNHFCPSKWKQLVGDERERMRVTEKEKQNLLY